MRPGVYFAWQALHGEQLAPWYEAYVLSGDMRLPPFPASSHLRWRRIDVPGTEEATVQLVSGLWILQGSLDVEEDAVHARLRYRIECDAEWRTRSALIEGEADGPVLFALTADGHGNWTRESDSLPEVTGAIDIDLGFTPMTNTLPIRRLALEIGEAARVRSAWLRFPELRIEPLEQTYVREATQRYRYEAQVDGEPFTALLETDVFGRVIRYEGLWEADYH